MSSGIYSKNTTQGSGPNSGKPPAGTNKATKPIKEKDGFYYPNPSQLEKVRAPWAKNLLPSNVKAVMIISATGNVEMGLTSAQFEMLPLEDLQMAGRADQFAKESIKETKKATLQKAAAFFAKKNVEDEKTWSTAPRTVEVGFETLTLYRNLAKNVKLLRRNTNVDPVSTQAKNYLLYQSALIKDVLAARYKAMLVDVGDKSLFDLRKLLGKASAPYASFAKMTSPTDIIQSTEHDVSRVLFPKNTAKHFSLTVAEARDDVIVGMLAAFPTVLERSGTTITAARDDYILDRAVEVNGTRDPALLEKYMRQQVTIVGPGPLAANWSKPVPSRPVNTDTFAGELLQINKENVDFHLGVIPFGRTAKSYWDEAVKPGEFYATGLTKSVSVQAAESGMELSSYNRDELDNSMFYRVATLLGGAAMTDTIRAGLEGKYIPIPILPTAGEIPDLENLDYLSIDPGTSVRVAFDQLPDLKNMISKLFLRPVDEEKRTSKKEPDRPAQSRVPRAIAEEITEFVRDGLLSGTAAKLYRSFLASFRSAEMMKKAHVAFASKVEEIDLRKALEDSVPNDNDDF